MSMIIVTFDLDSLNWSTIQFALLLQIQVMHPIQVRIHLYRFKFLSQCNTIYILTTKKVHTFYSNSREKEFSFYSNSVTLVAVLHIML